MALLPAKCPECGEFIEIDNEKRAGVCQHCNQPFVIEDAIRKFNDYYNITITKNTNNNDMDNVSEDKPSDFLIDTEGVLKRYRGTATDIVIPNNVTSIGYSCFYRSEIKSIVLPNSVISIESQAFAYCSNLTSIIIPKSVTKIKLDTFKGCTSLVSVSIPNSVTSIGGRAFYKCTHLTSVTIPDSVTNIGNYAFGCCSNLTNINISVDLLQKNKLAFSKEHISRVLRTKGLCQYCGAEFKGVFVKMCTNCKKPKDY